MGKDRRVGIAMDFSESSRKALQWALDNLADKGDTFHVITTVTHPHNSTKLQSPAGSPLIPMAEFRKPDVMKKYDVKIDIGVLDTLDTAIRQKEIIVVWKIYWGDAREELCKAAVDLKLDSMVVGDRGLGPLSRMILGSVTDYLVTHAACPVTIIKDPDFRKP